MLLGKTRLPGAELCRGQGGMWVRPGLWVCACVCSWGRTWGDLWGEGKRLLRATLSLQVTGFLPHLLLPERPVHSPALWQWSHVARRGPWCAWKRSGKVGGVLNSLLHRFHLESRAATCLQTCVCAFPVQTGCGAHPSHPPPICTHLWGCDCAVNTPGDKLRVLGRGCNLWQRFWIFIPESRTQTTYQ